MLADIRKKNVDYFCHITRYSKRQHALLEGKIEGRRSQGRPTTAWTGNITHWSGFGYVEATRKAQDRNYWRQLIASDQQWMESDDVKALVEGRGVTMR